MKFLLIVLLWMPLLANGQAMDFSGGIGPSNKKEVKRDTTVSQLGNKKRSKFLDNAFLGGNFGLQFGSITLINISPLFGYQVFKGASAGIGLTYQYLNYDTPNINYTAHTFGASVFARYIIWKGIMVHTEFEMLNLDCPVRDVTGEFSIKREWVPGVLLGGGYILGVSNRVGLQALVLVNILQSECTPYANPVFRLGFNFGI